MNNDINISGNTDPNADMWLKFKSGDAAAFGELAQIHYRALYNYATKFSSDSDFIRDCIQELYLELWERRSFLSETAFVKSYLLKALRHKLIKESLRLKRFKEHKELSFDADDADLSIESHIIENEQLKHQIKRLNQIVSHLTKRQQEIIYLRFYQNLENEDIAQIMSLGRQSVANLLYRTIKEIKDIWMPAEFFWGLLLIAFC
ncbi:RNA polymerase sigma factor [Dyadobacter subterraneus]|uniref:Sigma-70 family RNA polymerase sigma factor n=1 Tax=Dyadobacter subterraneus TaxID=2773304 RepID=A0ABR9WFI0_9BACT|nr:sigma-70 family RNA polymerase sigma factor [Dyadobacter subterraneus]MBE9462934.1 sigma-70 family RNA polymerase sigma factor [Dyadobacter subterraneus]